MILSATIEKVLRKYYGFTLIELMITIAIIGILATLTIPSNIAQRQRSDVADAFRTAKKIRDSVTDYYNIKLLFPSNNNQAGVPEPKLLISNKITMMEIEDGAIHITLGNKAVKPLQNKIISLRPAIVTGSPKSPISWLCGTDDPVPGMEAIGKNKTNIIIGLMPASCGN